MARAWYGSLENRIEENRMFTDEIKVGTGMTEYLYSDRKAYEVTEVEDQKHVTVRLLDARRVDSNGMSDCQDWELTSNPDNPEYLMTKRGKYWYYTSIITPDRLRDDWETDLWLAHNNTSREEVEAKGKVVRYHRANVSFGRADYYYDFSF